MNTPSNTHPVRRWLRLPGQPRPDAASTMFVSAEVADTPAPSSPAPVPAGREHLLDAELVPLDPERGRLRTGRRRNGADKLQLSHMRGHEAGMATAEYAIATLAAVGLAGLLVVLLRSDEVRGFLLNLIRTALSLP